MEMKKFIFGRTYLRGGFHPNDKTKPIEIYYDHLPARYFWLWSIEKTISFIVNFIEIRTSIKGIRIRIGFRWFMFFWAPLAPLWRDSKGDWHKSKKFSYLTINKKEKGNIMNDKITVVADEAAENNPDNLPTIAELAGRRPSVGDSVTDSEGAKEENK